MEESSSLSFLFLCLQFLSSILPPSSSFLLSLLPLLSLHCSLHSCHTFLSFFSSPFTPSLFSFLFLSLRFLLPFSPFSPRRKKDKPSIVHDYRFFRKMLFAVLKRATVKRGCEHSPSLATYRIARLRLFLNKIRNPCRKLGSSLKIFLGYLAPGISPGGGGGQGPGVEEAAKIFELKKF